VHYSYCYIAQVPFRTIPRRVQAVYTNTLDLTATYNRSPDRVGFVAYAPFDGLEGLGGSHGLLHLHSTLYNSSLIFLFPPFYTWPASVNRGSGVSTLSARAGDRRVRGLVILWTGV
jgi:hypothetical protein